MPLKFPPLFLLTANFHKDPQELYRLQEEIRDVHGALVFKKEEAKIFLVKEITAKKRTALELRKLGIWTREITYPDGRGHDEAELESQKSPRKRRKLSSSNDGWEIINNSPGSSTESDDDLVIEEFKSTPAPKNHGLSSRANDEPSTPKAATPRAAGSPKLITVLKISWYLDSVKSGELLPYDDYLVYEGELLPGSKNQPSRKITLPSRGNDILARAKEDTLPSSGKRSVGKYNSSRTSKSHYSQSSGQRPELIHETTEEHEGTDMPPLPDYLHSKYCCHRRTPLHCQNEDFIAQLRIIQKARDIEHAKGNEFNGKTYNGAIAAIASYPHTLMSRREVLRLPKCGNKIVGLWQEWHETGHIKEVDDLLADPRMQALNIFYDIYDVGEKRAKEFYNRGWTELNDAIKNWDKLTRNQQIGVKYFDEFREKIPRVEVEHAANVILDHVNRIRDGFQMVICGGYRRGKPESGDIDVVLSHPDEEVTNQFLETLLNSLEEDPDHPEIPFYITHRLTVSTRNSDRGQEAVSWKGLRKAGSGFDTLDHAFVVWQDFEWATKAEDLSNDPDFRNPNTHRRVDIIIAPWKTAGCAVIGWSGGTMFERDLRSYCKEQLGLKFDSSGVRRQDDGSWVDLEAGGGDLLVKEKRVFAGLKLEWREPTERCTD